MSIRLRQLEKEAVEYEVRPVAPVEIVHEGGSPWRSFAADRKVLRQDVVDVIEHAFDCGGFVAGGCARWLRTTAPTPLARGAYVHEGGDIDLFFYDPQSWAEFLAAYAENDSVFDAPTVELSEGKLAANINFRGQHRGYNAPPKVQAIRCVTGTPEEVLRSFDFVNSMVAFDREQVWIAENWDEFDKSKTLGVAWWGSRSIAFRMKKYATKYGFNKFIDLSQGQMFEQLVEVTNRMTDKMKLTSRDAWLQVLSCADAPLETKLLILASTSSGIETDDLFNLSRATPSQYIGGYHRIINELTARQEAAKKRLLEITRLPPKQPHRADLDLEDLFDEGPAKWAVIKPAHVKEEPVDLMFDANEYCWAR